MEITKRIPTKEEALERLQAYCSRAERCSSHITGLLHRWGVPQEDHREILACLEKDRFIDDRRYADAFVRDKLRHGGWGTRKIAQALTEKRIPKTFIEKALEQSDGETMSARLEKIMAAKLPAVKARNAYELKGKLFRFGLSRGFSPDEVSRAVEKLTRHLPTDTEEDFQDDE